MDKGFSFCTAWADSLVPEEIAFLFEVARGSLVYGLNRLNEINSALAA
jgi:hypothetical protein